MTENDVLPGTMNEARTKLIALRRELATVTDERDSYSDDIKALSAAWLAGGPPFDVNQAILFQVIAAIVAKHTAAQERVLNMVRKHRPAPEAKASGFVCPNCGGNSYIVKPSAIECYSPEPTRDGYCRWTGKKEECGLTPQSPPADAVLSDPRVRKLVDAVREEQSYSPAGYGPGHDYWKARATVNDALAPFPKEQQ
jgi:hypothetical protein